MQLTRAVEMLEENLDLPTTRVGVSSAITADLLTIFLRKHGLLNKNRIQVVSGYYDDPIGDAELFKKEAVNHNLIIPFFDNLMASFEAQIPNISVELLAAKELEFIERYTLVFETLKNVSSVHVCSFHRFGKSVEPAKQDLVDEVLERFNAALENVVSNFPNVRMINSDAIFSEIGRGNALDKRFYMKTKSPYTAAYYDSLAKSVASNTRGFSTYFYKVLALDCDNTLWGGVIGEDLLDGIKLSPYDYPGNIFWRMQNEFAALERKGVLIALVSKNNPEDIDDVFENHPNMVLKQRHIVAKKVNWMDKPSNLRELAKELNLGLDSFIFLDDSSFECEAVKQQLPMVKTFQVPKKLSDYLSVVEEIKELFLAGGIDESSASKTSQYKQRAEALCVEAAFGNQEEYLASLKLKVTLALNQSKSIARISELSQKSNQFNLTTHRYSVGDIASLMSSDNSDVYSIHVEDKFGDAGLTGVVVVTYREGIAHIDNFFMSCRVIGRGVETCIWSRIFARAAECGCKVVQAEYKASLKNAMVADFYAKLGMPIKNSDEKNRVYEASAEVFSPPAASWIEISYAD